MDFINGYVGRCKYKANRGRLQCTYSELLAVAESNLPNAISKMATQAKSHGMGNHRTFCVQYQTIIPAEDITDKFLKKQLDA